MHPTPPLQPGPPALLVHFRKRNDVKYRENGGAGGAGCRRGDNRGLPVIYNTTFYALKPSAATPAPSAATVCTI